MIYIKILKIWNIHRNNSHKYISNFNDERSKYFIEKFDNIKNLFINYADNNEIKMPSITEELNLSKVLYYLNEYRYNEIIKMKNTI